MTEDEAADALHRLLNAHIEQRYLALKSEGNKLAHYTSAENALNIISGKTIWLRNAALMNDYMEVSYGKQCLVEAMTSALPQFEAALEAHHGALTAEIFEWLNRVQFAVNTQTYLTSLGVHPADDELGKLSMWRAYGGPVAGVAIVFNTAVFESESAGLNAFTHPVLYGPSEFNPVFAAMLESLQQSGALVGQLPKERARAILSYTLQDLVLTTKHPGFKEEEEWRVIHSPLLIPSEYVRSEIHSVGGIPQSICKIELRDQPGLNMPELELNRLIHRVIIGPCQYPLQVAHALDQALQDAGVTDAGSRIKISRIPLRQRG